MLRFSQPVSAQTGLTGTHLYPDRRWSTGFRAGFRTAAIATAFLTLGLVPGDVVALDQRGTEVAAIVVALPFVRG